MDKQLRIQLDTLVKTEMANRHLTYLTKADEQSIFDTIFQTYSIFLSNYQKELKEIIGEYVIPSDVTMVVNEGSRQEPWILLYKKNNKMPYWRGYCQYLSKTGKANLSQLDYETDMIMDNLLNPKSYQGNFDKRGLVFGNVQSGKTSNFIGLINKAADCGYKLIIVLSGMYSDLRKQTQERIDLGFVGSDTGGSFKGWRSTPNVGQFHEQNDGWFGVNACTSNHIDGDIDMDAIQNLSVNMNNSAPTLLVCKKNFSVLNALIQFLCTRIDNYKDQSGYVRIGNVPLLLVDDEADSASVNGQYDAEEIKNASTINAQIRCLLNLFDRSAYVGYTATPYANVLMPKDANNEVLFYDVPNIGELPYGPDLFPNDFIINLKTNTDYIGADEIFQWNDDSVLPVISRFPDDEMKYFNVLESNDLPPCVKSAILTFIASTVVKRLRGLGKNHSTMLFHVDRLIIHIDKWAEIIHGYILWLKQEIFGNTASGNNVLYKIYNIYINDLVGRREIIDHNLILRFGDIENVVYNKEIFDKEVYMVLNKLEVRSIHSEQIDNTSLLTQPLNYKDYEHRNTVEENGLYVIAIGGNKLSRGLTLEGLTVSFFYRYAKAYDTLMQMGRWFGYRPGYYDVCRLYITPELETIFSIVSKNTKQLRDDIDSLMNSSATPRDVIMKIQIGANMLPTARNRMGDGFMIPSTVLEGHKSTSVLKIDTETRLSRINVCLDFFNGIGSSPQFREDRKNNYIWEHVPGEKIVDFVRRFNCIEDPTVVLLDLLLENKMKEGFIVDWTVVLVNNSLKKYGQHVFNILGKDISVSLTKRINYSKNTELFSLPRGIFSGKDEGLDFDQDIVKSCKSYEIRRMRSPLNALLVIYPMTFSEDDAQLIAEYANLPLMGFAMSFPEKAVDIPEIAVVSGINFDNY